MQLHDYTQVFQVERKLRRVDNIVLLREVSYRALAWGAGATVVAAVVWFALLGRAITLLPLPGLVSFTLPVLFIGGAAVTFGKAATSRMRYGKELSALVSSWLRYRTHARRYVAFRPWSSTGPQHLVVEAVLDTRP